MKSGITNILENDYDWWSTVKQRVSRGQRLSFLEGEIWWAYLGYNIGVESNGKSLKLMRPVFILKKFNALSCLCVPITSSEKQNPYRIPIGKLEDRTVSVIISQIRYIDSKRLFKKMKDTDPLVLSELKRKASDVISASFS